MGFFKRLMSMGSRRNKKRRAVEQVGEIPISREDREKIEEEQEATASRLLRSSSAHFSVVSEVDYASLPPLPHPINGLNVTPVPSPSRAASIQTRGKYSVKVHDRKIEACTEFPNANPPIETPTRNCSDNSLPQQSRRHAVTPRDQNRMHRLRQDPSVVSLLDMYDSHGQLDNKAFSNSPVKEGRAQVKRNGSTLRQLLGNPESATQNGETIEGDISWAERFLDEEEEHRARSSVMPSSESFGFDAGGRARNAHDKTITVKTDTTFIYADDHSNDDIDNDRIISSMEVELSLDSEEARNDIPASGKHDFSTPHRASEVFGFLLDKDRRGETPRQTRSSDESERPLPAIPLNLNADSSTNSANSPDLNVITAIPSSSRRNAFDLIHSSRSPKQESPSSPGSIFDDPPQTAMIMNRTPVAVADSILRQGSQALQVQMTPSNLPTSRIPRGPRGPHSSSVIQDNPFETQTPQAQQPSQRRVSKESTKSSIRPSQIPTRDVLRATTNASSKKSKVHSASRTPVSSRKGQGRSISRGSAAWSLVDEPSMSQVGNETITPTAAKSKSSRARPLTDVGKENTPSPNASIELSKESGTKPHLHVNFNKTKLPVTPARSRSLFNPVHAPSPASSSELSPYAQQMMANVRKSRSKREEGRKRSRFAEVVSRA